MHTLKKIAMWTGIVLTGMCGVVLLGGGKITSGALLVTTAFVMALLVGRNKVHVWIRVVLLCAIFGLVGWNISTTELPGSTEGMVMVCGTERDEPRPSTGFKFLDQLIYIGDGFLSQAAPS